MPDRPIAPRMSYILTRPSRNEKGDCGTRGVGPIGTRRFVSGLLIPLRPSRSPAHSAGASFASVGTAAGSRVRPSRQSCIRHRLDTGVRSRPRGRSPPSAVAAPRRPLRPPSARPAAAASACGRGLGRGRCASASSRAASAGLLRLPPLLLDALLHHVRVLLGVHHHLVGLLLGQPGELGQPCGVGAWSCRCTTGTLPR